MPTERISFDEEKGPISVEITSGYASIGSYQLVRRKDGEYVQFAKDRPRRIDDEVPDSIVLPIPEDKIGGKMVSIRGNYKPAPGHEQVKVTYVFTQDGEAIHETTVEEKAGDRPYLRFSHRFIFDSDPSS